MPKNILFDQEARNKVFKGINKMAQAVGCTMGPDGKTMLIDFGRLGRPQAVKDGVTVAKHVELEDPEEALGAQIAYEASAKTNDQAGDATTCAMVLLNEMVNEGVKHVVAGRNVNQVRKGMLNASKLISEELDKMATKIETDEQIAHIGTISAQDPVIGETIAAVMAEIGPESTVTVDIQQSAPGIEYEILKGFQIGTGMHPLFSTDKKKMEFNQQEALVLVSDDPIVRQEQLLPMLDVALKAGQRTLCIFAPHMEADAVGSPMMMLIRNKLEGKINPLFINVPNHGELQRGVLHDIAIYTGAHLFSAELGNPLPEGIGSTKDDKLIEGVSLDKWGHAKRVIADMGSTAIVGGGGTEAKIEEHLEELKAQLPGLESNFHKEFMRERIGCLTSGVGVIRVSASTELESEELRLRMDDALSSVRSAIEEGIVPGGGVALLRAKNALDAVPDSATEDEIIGINIIQKAIEKPAWQIATVSGEKGDAVVEKILSSKEKFFGYNASKKEYGDMMKAGIIDPKKAIRCALENATSVAATLLTMYGTITTIPEPEQAQG